MSQPFDIVTFDCYGTLIDWESGIADAFLSAAQKDGIALNRKQVLLAYEHVEPIVERERYRLYRDVLTETALRIAKSLGWPLTPVKPRSSRSRCRNGNRFPTRTPPSNASANPAIASASSLTSTTTCSRKRDATSLSNSISSLPRSKSSRINRHRRIFVRRRSASATRDGCTPHKATFTTSCR
ncbi:MAG TPA: hypothetical protein VGQ76_07185 [Thermoanaerobaculia bacterium]|jgi:hypothetical protein|nr:hypothetical protein [Thermoanaerobaculia bacterium]